MKTARTNRLLLLAGAGAALTVIAAAVTLALLLRSFDDKANLLASIASEAVRETQLIRQKKDLAAALPDQEKLESSFVSKDEVPHFLERVETEAHGRGVELTVGNLSIVPKDSRSTLVVEATVSGSYRSAVAFESALENLPYVISVAATDLRAQTDKAGGWEGHITFVLQSYEN